MDFFGSSFLHQMWNSGRGHGMGLVLGLGLKPLGLCEAKTGSLLAVLIGFYMSGRYPISISKDANKNGLCCVFAMCRPWVPLLHALSLFSHTSTGEM